MTIFGSKQSKAETCDCDFRDAYSNCCKLKVAVDALEQLTLGHEHNENDDNYRPLGDTYGWCSSCSTKVGLNEDAAREALAKIRGSDG